MFCNKAKKTWGDDDSIKAEKKTILMMHKCEKYICNSRRQKKTDINQALNDSACCVFVCKVCNFLSLMSMSRESNIRTMKISGEKCST